MRRDLATSEELKLATAKLETAIARLEPALATSKTKTIRWFFVSQVLLFGAVAVAQNIKFH